MVTGSVSWSISSPNILRSLNWSNCWHSPASYSFQVGHIFNLQHVKVPNVCSSGVIFLDVNNTIFTEV